MSTSKLIGQQYLNLKLSCTGISMLLKFVEDNKGSCTKLSMADRQMYIKGHRYGIIDEICGRVQK